MNEMVETAKQDVNSANQSWHNFILEEKSECDENDSDDVSEYQPSDTDCQSEYDDHELRRQDFRRGRKKRKSLFVIDFLVVLLFVFVQEKRRNQNLGSVCKLITTVTASLVRHAY